MISIRNALAAAALCAGVLATSLLLSPAAVLAAPISGPAVVTSQSLGAPTAKADDVLVAIDLAAMAKSADLLAVCATCTTSGQALSGAGSPTLASPSDPNSASSVGGGSARPNLWPPIAV